MLVQNLAFAGRVLRVSSDISEDNQLVLDENGCAEVEEITAKKLLAVPGFGLAKEKCSEPKDLKTVTEPITEEAPSEEINIEPTDDQTEGPMEGDTKVEDGKAYVYRKHGKTGVLDWFRDQENDA